MTIEGHVEKGAIVLDPPTPLPEGTKVRVEVLSAGIENGVNSVYEHIKLAIAEAKKQSASSIAQTLAERYAGALGTAVDLPEDLAERHDHYIHGSDQ